MKTITREELQALFDTHSTYKDIIVELGMDPYAGGGYRTIKAYIERYHLDLSRFNQLKDAARLERREKLNTFVRKHTTDNVFKLHTIRIEGRTLKTLMLDAGFEDRCSECKIIDVYNNLPITLQVDHIDGNCFNNNRDNLRFLCPNCHSQTINYGSKNRRGKKIRGKTRAEFWSKQNGLLVEKNRELIARVEASDIDFNKFGWSGQVATLIGKSPQKVAKWMRRYMPDFYETRCFKRKTPA